MFCEGSAYLPPHSPKTAERLPNSSPGQTPVTFVDYFRSQNLHLFGDDILAAYVKRALCVAASHTLFSGDLTQSAAIWYARHDLEEILDLTFDRSRHWTFPERSVELVTHVARLSGRATGALNLLHVGTAFVVQVGFGALLQQWPSDGGHSPLIAYQASFAAILVLEVLALLWFVAPRGRHRSQRFAAHPIHAIATTLGISPEAALSYAHARQSWRARSSGSRRGS